MVKLFRSMKFFDDKDILYDNEIFFDTQVNMSEMYGDFLDIMMLIDNAKLIDKKLGTIETPYGICNRDCLSTGCKTALNIIFLDRHREEYKNKKAVNVTECGANALEVIFDYADKYNMNLSFILEHCDDLFECKERNYLIDNKIEVKSLGFYWANLEV